MIEYICLLRSPRSATCHNPDEKFPWADENFPGRDVCNVLFSFGRASTTVRTEVILRRNSKDPSELYVRREASDFWEASDYYSGWDLSKHLVYVIKNTTKFCFETNMGSEPINQPKQGGAINRDQKSAWVKKPAIYKKTSPL